MQAIKLLTDNLKINNRIDLFTGIELYQNLINIDSIMILNNIKSSQTLKLSFINNNVLKCFNDVEIIKELIINGNCIDNMDLVDFICNKQISILRIVSFINLNFIDTIFPYLNKHKINCLHLENANKEFSSNLIKKFENLHFLIVNHEILIPKNCYYPILVQTDY